jgi:hypothetical protein
MVTERMRGWPGSACLPGPPPGCCGRRGGSGGLFSARFATHRRKCLRLRTQKGSIGGLCVHLKLRGTPMLPATTLPAAVPAGQDAVASAVPAGLDAASQPPAVSG